MSSFRQLGHYHEDFFGDKVYSSTADANGWKINETKTAGSPSVATASHSQGAVKLTIDSTSEAQDEVLYHGDVLSFDPANLMACHFILNAATVGSNSTVIAGLAAAHNATPTSITQYAWFTLSGSYALNCGIHGTSVSTGLTLTSGTDVHLVIDFSHGLTDVRFYADNGNGQLVRVAAGTTFDISGYAGSYFQPYLKSGKSTGADTPVLTVDLFSVEYKH